jgi:hypothetical protein
VTTDKIAYEDLVEERDNFKRMYEARGIIVNSVAEERDALRRDLKLMIERYETEVESNMELKAAIRALLHKGELLDEIDLDPDLCVVLKAVCNEKSPTPTSEDRA